MAEIWKPIDHFRGLYEVSNLGNVRTSLFGWNIELLQRINKSGYFFVNLARKKNHYCVAVHTLVAKAFIPNPLNKETIDHINGNKLDNRADNLRWATRSENNLYALMLGKNSDTKQWKIDRLKEKVKKGF